MMTVGDDYPNQQARCRELLEGYKEIGPAGAFGYMMISQVLARADRAAISGDVAEMLKSYQEMKECQ
jgi:hypothetical protein